MIIHGDCLEGMKEMPTNSVDLCVTDPPYKITAGGIKSVPSSDDVSGIFNKRKFVSDGTDCSNKWLKKQGNPCAVKDGRMFEYNDIEFIQWLPEVYRVLKPQTHCYVMSNGMNLCKLQQVAEDVGFVYQNILVWDKGNCTPNRYYMQAAEYILMLSKRPARSINDKGTKNIIRVPNIIGNKVHPTEKPVELMTVLIEQSSNEGQIVIDPFAGSGTTLLAAKNLNRRYIGFELDAEYIKIIEARLK